MPWAWVMGLESQVMSGGAAARKGGEKALCPQLLDQGPLHVINLLSGLFNTHWDQRLNLTAKRQAHLEYWLSIDVCCTLLYTKACVGPTDTKGNRGDIPELMVGHLSLIHSFILHQITV